MRRGAALALAAALVLAGCHRKEITSIDRLEAANMVSEAEFAVTIHDWARAEGLYAKATERCPDQADTWVNLGIVRMRLHDPRGARSAYKSALGAYEDDSRREPTNSMPVIRRAYVLVLLGRADEARSLVERARSDNPEDRRLRSFIEHDELTKMLADPSVKEISP
ncbi:MAG: hypothetical protein WAK51_04010 [Opitutaceae bacterium]|jgi:tetratricopeptide (TPR) repeat protein